MRARRDLMLDEIAAHLPALFAALSPWEFGTQREVGLGDHWAWRDSYGHVRVSDPQSQCLVMASLHRFSDDSYRPVIDYVVDDEHRLAPLPDLLSRHLVLNQLAAL